jgi:hypothetical protein
MLAIFLATIWQHIHEEQEEHEEIFEPENQRIMNKLMILRDTNNKSWVRIPPARPKSLPIGRLFWRRDEEPTEWV